VLCRIERENVTQLLITDVYYNKEREKKEKKEALKNL
jgi:hypothetical protein